MFVYCIYFGVPGGFKCIYCSAICSHMYANLMKYFDMHPNVLISTKNGLGVNHLGIKPSMRETYICVGV